MSVSRGQKISVAIRHILLIIVVLVSVYPVFIMISGSFKSASELIANASGFPIDPTLINYQKILSFSSGLLFMTYGNSIFVATAYTFLTLIIASMAGFAFAKYKFKGKEVMFILLLFTMMVPAELNMPPLYLLFSKVGWLNTYQVQIFPGIANVFALFLFRQYMESIPDSLIDAARIDGAGHLRTYASIIIPTAMPAVGALGILVFLGKWNDYLFPKIMLNKTRFMPIMVVLPTLSDEETSYAIPWEFVLTGCTLVTVPLLIVFLIFQDKFMSSVTIGAVKG